MGTERSHDKNLLYTIYTVVFDICPLIGPFKETFVYRPVLKKMIQTGGISTISYFIFNILFLDLYN